MAKNKNTTTREIRTQKNKEKSKKKVIGSDCTRNKLLGRNYSEMAENQENLNKIYNKCDGTSFFFYVVVVFVVGKLYFCVLCIVCCLHSSLLFRLAAVAVVYYY